ncbi:MAG: hypothetical protein Q8P81_01975, partial [Nanoarchaeota archaeon]|nr:hypothetical protein [Nanoarchaeota archaeon]
MTTRNYGQRSTGRSINRASMPNSIPPLQVRNYVELAGGLKELGLDSEDLFEYCIGEFLGED